MIYDLLAQVPIWLAAFVLVILCVGVLHPMREANEGFPYNISYASEVGDICLITIVLIGLTVLQQRGLPTITLQNGASADWGNFARWWGWLSLALAILWPTCIRVLQGKGTWTDFYHNIFIVPLLFFLLGVAGPLIWFVGSGQEFIWACLLLYAWAGLLLYDNFTGRLQQTLWLEKNFPGLAKDMKR